MTGQCGMLRATCSIQSRLRVRPCRPHIRCSAIDSCHHCCRQCHRRSDKEKALLCQLDAQAALDSCSATATAATVHHCASAMSIARAIACPRRLSEHAHDSRACQIMSLSAHATIVAAKLTVRLHVLAAPANFDIVIRPQPSNRWCSSPQCHLPASAASVRAPPATPCCTPRMHRSIMSQPATRSPL